LPFSLEKRRDLLVDRDRAEHDGTPRAVEHRPLGRAVKVRDHLDGPERVERAAIEA
jgi:hypothetical protein